MLNCFLVLLGKNEKREDAVLSAFDQIRGDLLEQTPFVPQRVTVHAHPTQPLVIYSAELELGAKTPRFTRFDAWRNRMLCGSFDA